MKENWIIPCNSKVFDAITYLKTHDEIVFKKVSSLKKDDNAYIYVSAPYSEILYKGHIVDDNVCEQDLVEHSYAKVNGNGSVKKIRYIKILIDRRFCPGTLKREDLKKYGLGQTQMQARTERRVQSYIDEVERTVGL